MENNIKKKKTRVGELIWFYFYIVLATLGLFLIGGNIYGKLMYNNAITVGLYGGFVICIFAGIEIYKNNPYKYKG